VVTIWVTSSGGRGKVYREAIEVEKVTAALFLGKDKGGSSRRIPKAEGLTEAQAIKEQLRLAKANLVQYQKLIAELEQFIEELEKESKSAYRAKTTSR
jgi:hypothetical protein